MPTPPKSSDSMSKHMTNAEKEARQSAEGSVNPDRGQVTLKKPSWLTGRGKKYWDLVIERMNGTAILDDLDTEMLAIYCSQLAERDALQADLKKARAAEEEDISLILTLTKQLNAKDAKIRDYANELGCTPSGRVRLAQKRASATENTDPNGDLFD